MKNKEARIVGFDCGQAEHLAVLLDEDGEIVRKERVTNRMDLVEAALRSFLEEIGPERDLVVAMVAARILKPQSKLATTR